MNKKSLIILGVLVLLVISILLPIILNKNEKKIDEVEINKEEMNKEEVNKEENEGSLAVDFKLEDMNGDYITLSDLRGEKVYLKFWASWCTNCVDGLDELDELFVMENDFKAYTIVMSGVNGEMNKDKFVKWIKERGNKNIKILFDYEGKIAREYGIRAVPT